MSIERSAKILLSPRITEKSSQLGDRYNQYVFEVTKDATKPEIKVAVEELLKVKVANVRTINRKGDRMRTKHGWGKRNDIKKAVVTLADGEQLDLTGIA